MSRAIRKMAKAGDIEALIAVLSDSDSKDRAAALDAIVECMGTHADLVKGLRRPILDACLPLVKDPDSRIRGASVSIATALRDRSASNLALAALSDPVPSVRMSGLIAVFHLQPPGSLSSVMRLLHDEDPWVRKFAVGAMERVGDRSSVGSLLQAQEREEDPRVRDAIDDVVAILEGLHPPTPIEPFMEDPGT